MTKHMLRLILLLLALLLPLHALAEPADDKLMGTVRIKANMKLDAQARKEIAAAATRIKKSKIGAVKLRGSFLAAKNADEYFSKSIFMAREVEQYLKTLLSPRQQIYTMTTQFTPGKRGGQNFVEILLYPHELAVDKVEGFNVNTLESTGGSGTTAVQEAPAALSPPVAEPVPEAAASGSLSKPVEDETTVTTGRPAPAQPAEDAARAEELVRRTKERAAERARRKNDGD
jgi:hypothetical protein